MARGYPIPSGGTPFLGIEYPPEGTWAQRLGYPPGKAHGRSGWKYYGMEVVVDKLKTLPSVILRIAGG